MIFELYFKFQTNFYKIVRAYLLESARQLYHLKHR